MNFRGEQLNIFFVKKSRFFSSFTLAVVSCPAAQAIAPRFKEAVTVTAAVTQLLHLLPAEAAVNELSVFIAKALKTAERAEG